MGAGGLCTAPPAVEAQGKHRVEENGVRWAGVPQLTSRKEQLTMSRMMQPRDQMSAFLLKEKLRASGAIQDF